MSAIEKAALDLVAAWKENTCSGGCEYDRGECRCHYAIRLAEGKLTRAAREAQRMTTTEDNKDQGALEAIAKEVCWGCHYPENHARPTAQRILSALAEAGYTVVKTKWEYGVEIGPHYYATVTAEYAYDKRRNDKWSIARRLSCLVDSPWEPVLEGGEQ